MTVHTILYTDFKGPAHHLEDKDIPALANRIGCGEDELHPMIDVETAGGGFDHEGRPKMLFEPHKFYAHLSGAKRDKAVKDRLAYKSWGMQKYPADSYPRLLAAMKIDAEAALMSASWAMGQVMGENHKMAGYDDVFAMVNAACEDEENGLNMMVNFIIANHLDDDLRAIAKLSRKTTPADWAPIARAYNGSKYAAHNYHGKLSDSYNKWRGIPDTKWQPEDGVIDVGVVKPPAAGVMQIRDLQQALRDKGYVEVGKVDGLMGKNTLAAIAAFEIANNLPVTATYSVELYNKVVAAPMRPVSEERANATTATLVKDDQPMIKPAVMLRNIGTAAAAVTGLGAIFDGGQVDLDKIMSSTQKLKEIYTMFGNVGPWLIGLSVSGVVLYFAHNLIAKQVSEYRKGTLR